MIRTITVKHTRVRHKGNYFGPLLEKVIDEFGLFDGKYKISITEKKSSRGDRYEFSERFACSSFYRIRKNGVVVAHICKKSFEELFFKPRLFQNYSIVIKEIKDEAYY